MTSQSSRMICMVKPNDSEIKSYTLSDILMELPSSQATKKWVTINELVNLEKMNDLNGKSQSIIAPNTEMILGNTVIENTIGYLPKCVITQNKPEIAKKYQCITLHNTKPNDYNKKWIANGCPYSIDANTVKKFDVKSVKEILPFVTPTIEDYEFHIAKIRNHIPITKHEYNQFIKPKL